ncbi:MAG: 50S ribosomal protein L10 [Anaerolineae bacterium]
MAITKDKKVEMVADYVDKLSRSRAMIMADYRGLTVANITQLRSNLREVEGVFQVVKNSLFERALEEAGLPIPAEQMEGPLAIGYCFGDVPPMAKALTDFAKEADVLEIKGAILGQDLLSVKQVKDLAALPPREVVRAQLVAMIQGPMSSLVNTLNAPMREIAQVLQARADQAQDQEEEAAA